MGLNDIAWERLFDDHNILNEIHCYNHYGVSRTSAQTILRNNATPLKKWYNAR